MPTPPGASMVLTIRRLSKSQTRTVLRRTGGPGATSSVESGRMKSLVSIRFRSGRTEIPCGLKPSAGGLAGHEPTRRSQPSNSTTRPGAPPLAEPIWVTRNPPFGSGKKSSVMLEFGSAEENRNRGLLGWVTSKKKIPGWPLRTLRSPPHARTFLSADRCMWWGSLKVAPGPGRGTTLMTFP